MLLEVSSNDLASHQLEPKTKDSMNQNFKRQASLKTWNFSEMITEHTVLYTVQLLDHSLSQGLTATEGCKLLGLFHT